jgi:hypothetical protein
MFLMGRDEIDHVTHDIAPLTDIYPKRLTDEHWDEQESHRFALPYMEATSAVQRFRGSPVIGKIWSQTSNDPLESCFIIRQTRYRCRIVERCNTLAELDVYLRKSPLRTPVLEVLGSDEFRLAIAERVARKSGTPPLEIMPDLIAGALAQRNFDEAIRLLESEKQRGVSSLNDTFLLMYLYCLNGSVHKAEALAVANVGSITRNRFVDWLWEKLETDFGFRRPP